VPAHDAGGRPLAGGRALIIAALVGLALGVTLFGHYVRQPTPATTCCPVPSAAHWLGTDNIGRTCSPVRCWPAGRRCWWPPAPPCSPRCSACRSAWSAGYRGGLVDSALMAFVDTALSVPPVLLALTLRGDLLAGDLDPDGWRGTDLSRPTSPGWCAGRRVVREQDFVRGPDRRGRRGAILRRHVLPNVAARSWSTRHHGGHLHPHRGVAELPRLGVQPPHPSWGRMVFEGQRYMLDSPCWS